MDETNDRSLSEQLHELVDAGSSDTAAALLSRLETEPAADRKAALQALKPLSGSTPAAVTPLVSALAGFLTDDDRAVRLSTAKLFVRLADSEPDALLDCVPALADRLADRLADDEEFYYVRARSAETLGYVAAAAPSVATPELVADLRIGLSFDEPEVRTKLAKALAYIALGDPGRLRHHVDDLAAHLDSEDELVGYHLATALVAVGSEFPGALSDVVDALAERADDPNPYVRGRAVEALGLLSHAEVETAIAIPDDWGVDAIESETAAAFLEPRVRFAVADEQPVDGIGDTEAIRDRSDEIVDAITTPDGEACPQCGLAVASGGPPMCPRCGRPV